MTVPSFLSKYLSAVTFMHSINRRSTSDMYPSVLQYQHPMTFSIVILISNYLYACISVSAWARINELSMQIYSDFATKSRHDWIHVSKHILHQRLNPAFFLINNEIGYDLTTVDKVLPLQSINYRTFLSVHVGETRLLPTAAIQLPFRAKKRIRWVAFFMILLSAFMKIIYLGHTTAASPKPILKSLLMRWI